MQTDWPFFPILLAFNQCANAANSDIHLIAISCLSYEVFLLVTISILRWYRVDQYLELTMPQSAANIAP